MFSTQRIGSVLAERRVMLFRARKQILGRRAYSESMRHTKAIASLTREYAEAAASTAAGGRSTYTPLRRTAPKTAISTPLPDLPPSPPQSPTASTVSTEIEV